MSDKRIRIGTSIPSLKDKIHVDLKSNSDVIYWYIRFNIPLDEASVSEKTMQVTDTDGYIMRTVIAYDILKNMIEISPIDTYLENKYYILSISKKVRSARGQRLKSEIHILFKLIGNQISEFKVLKKNVELPKPRPRGKDYDKKVSRTKVYSFDKTIMESVPRDKLPSADMGINIYAALLGLTLVIAAFFLNNPIFMVVAGVFCMIGIGHITYQLTRYERASIISYNIGVYHFNKERYEKADRAFRMALAKNPDNEMAEYASNKVSFYIDGEKDD